MASANTPSANEPAKDVILVHSTAITNHKSTNLRKNGHSSGISDVAFASVHSEKNRLKMLLIMIIIMKKLQQTTVFSGCQKLTSAMKLRPEK